MNSEQHSAAVTQTSFVSGIKINIDNQTPHRLLLKLKEEKIDSDYMLTMTLVVTEDVLAQTTTNKH